MIPEEITDGIKKQLRKGYPQGEIINDLKKQGYSKEEIEETFYSLTSRKGTQSGTGNIPLWFMLSIGFVILGIAILSVKYLWIYKWGYFFLVAGLAGICIKYFVLGSGKGK
jgi:hypothetical protein